MWTPTRKNLEVSEVLHLFLLPVGGAHQRVCLQVVTAAVTLFLSVGGAG